MTFILPENISTIGERIDSLYYVILWITGFFFFLVEGLLVWFIIRYRRREGGRAYYTHGNTALEIVWTAIPALILVALAFFSQGIWKEVRGGRAPSHSIPIRVTAEQFAWNISYPEHGIQTINQLFIPVGRPVRLTLRSKDVLHSFFLPNFRMKQDVLPGTDVDIWIDAKKTGKFEIACAELCGLGHYRMRGFLTVGTQEEYA
ncbi:MAG: cytochrome c oxidase subunit II, partial [Candidatus Omnitrophica bacterium]|nr:cytochrome c oxidase subunit II [Candidatus Omnitrophota bacterium]